MNQLTRSACIMLHFFMSDKARNIWWAYARTARRFIPTSFPNRLTTSLKFILLDTSKHINIIGWLITDIRHHKSHRPHSLKYQTEMTAMFKCSLESNDMVLATRVSLLQFLKNTGFFLTSFVPVRMSISIGQCGSALRIIPYENSLFT